MSGTEVHILLDALMAAGEPTRLRLLRLLAREELSVMELVSILGQSQPRISRHLKLMTEAGLIERFPDGAWVFYRLASGQGVRPLVDTILSLMDGAQGGHLSEDLRQLEAVRQARRRSAESYFETIAPDWDGIRSLYVPEAEVEAEILAMAGQKPYRNLVDLGTGSGRMLILLAPQAATAVGLDLSQHMLNLARARIHEAGLDAIDLRHGDIFGTGLQAGSADLVVIHQVLHFLSDPARAIAEAARLLNAGGRLLIADFQHHDKEIMREQYQHRRLGILQDDMEDWCAASGLHLGVTRALKPGNGDGLTVKIWLAEKIA
jgi:ArsR family transcriptional regulator